MKLDYISKEEAPMRRGNYRIKYASTVEEFADSGQEAARATLIEGEEVKKAYLAIKQYIRRKALPIDIVKRGDALYLLRD